MMKDLLNKVIQTSVMEYVRFTGCYIQTECILQTKMVSGWRIMMKLKYTALPSITKGKEFSRISSGQYQCCPWPISMGD